MRTILSFCSAICCLYAAGSILQMTKEVKVKQTQQDQAIQRILKEVKQ